MEKRTYLTIVPENKKDALRAAGRLPDGGYPLEYDRSHKLWFARPGADLEKMKPWLPENTVTGQHQKANDNLPPAEEFAGVLRDAGFVLPDNSLPEMDGKKHRVATEGDKPGSKSGVYQGFLDGRPAGWYQNHRASEGKVNWTSTGSYTYDPAEAVKQRALTAQKRWDREMQAKAEYAKVGTTLEAQWAKMPGPPDSHPYLVRKGVPATEGVRLDKYDNLVIPLRNIDGDMRSLQYIKADGTKTLKKDAEKTGNFFVAGGDLNPQRPILYAEGYATAASLHLATGIPVVMTVDAGNLVTVSRNLKERYPDTSHVILGEDDFTKKDNKGVIKAREAAHAIGGTYLIPQFTENERAQALAGSASFSDFNDIHQSRGLDAVRDQLAPVLDPLIPLWRDTFTEKTPVPEILPTECAPVDFSDYSVYLAQSAAQPPTLEEENGFIFSFGRLPGDITPPETAERINLDTLLQGLTSRQDGRTWIYALDGQDAFRDYGDRILMDSPAASENDRMILAALLSARANQRGAVEITGSQEFIQRTLELIADYQIEVHLKNPLQRAQFEALLKARAESAVPQDGLLIGRTSVETESTPGSHTPPVKMSVTEKETLQTGLTGKLLDAGKAPYQFDKSNSGSFYVQIRTQDGNKTFWGVELEQALKDSGKEIGDMVKLQFLGRKAVTVNVPVKDDEGKVIGHKSVETHRNHWTITPAADARLLVADKNSAAPAELAAYDGNTFWRLQQQIVNTASLPLTTPEARGHPLLYTAPDGRGQPAPETPPANVPVPPESKAAGSVVMHATAQDGTLLAHLVKAHGDYLQGVMRHNGELMHVLARLCTGNNGNTWLAVNSVQDDGALRYIGHGSAVNTVKNGMTHYDTFAFQMKGKDAPKYIVPLVAPEKIPPALHSKLGFQQPYTPPRTEEPVPTPQAKFKATDQPQPI